MIGEVTTETTQDQDSDLLVQWMTELELALYGKLGNTWEASRLRLTRAMFQRIEAQLQERQREADSWKRIAIEERELKDALQLALEGRELPE